MSSIISYPSGINFTSYTLQLIRKTIKMESPFSGARQTLASPYALWGFQGKYSQQVLTNAASLRSFLMQLQGQVNRFRLPVPDAQIPISGYTGNTGVVNGASQTGNTLVTNGWTINSLILADGDYFTVNDELKTVVGNVVTDGSGNATITFVPPLRTSPPALTQLKIGNAVNLFKYSQDFTNSIWAKTNCTVASGASDPLGGTSATTFTESSTGQFTVDQGALDNLSNQTWTFSIYIKQGTATASFNIIIANNAYTIYPASINITPTSSWVRYTLTVTFPANTTGWRIRINPAASIASGQTVLMFGAQFEKGSVATSYKLTTTGDGVPTVLLASTDDTAASWDLSPPIEYQIALNAIEALS